MISTETNSIAYTGNASTTTFAYTFPIQSNTWLKVYLDGVLKTINSDYTVTGVNNSSGGNIVFNTAPASGAKIVIARIGVDLKQLLNYIQGDQFPAKSHEMGLDKLTAIVQQLAFYVSRSIKLPEYESGNLNLGSLDSRRKKLMWFDANGDIQYVGNQPNTVLGFDESGLPTYETLPSGSPGDTFIQAGSGAVPRIFQNKAREIVSVKDFGAVGDGVTDDTAAFNAAIQTGKKVFIPCTSAGYVVNNVEVVSNLHIEGEKTGVADNGTKLLVTQNGASAFLAPSENVFNLYIANLICTTSASNAAFYKSINKEYYTAYANFNHIETHSDLSISYDIWPIFVTWSNCRDGYLGDGDDHMFIKSLPVFYGQTNQTNINKIEDCQIFNSSNTVASIDIGYGALLSFYNCDFENLTTKTIRARAMFQVSFENCWFEGIHADCVAEIDVYPDTAAGVEIRYKNCNFVLPTTTSYIVKSNSSLANAYFEKNDFNLINVGVKLMNDGTRVLYSFNNRALSGDGVSTFFANMNHNTIRNGVHLLNGAIDNGSGATIQNEGKTSAKAFTSTYDVEVNTSFKTIATINLTSGLCFINGYNNSGGAQGWWLVGFGAGVVTVIASQNDTLLTVNFQLSGPNLQMRTTSGMLKIATALLV